MKQFFTLLMLMFCSLFATAHCEYAHAEVVGSEDNGNGTYTWQIYFCVTGEVVLAGYTGALDFVFHDAQIISYSSFYVSSQSGYSFQATSPVNTDTTSTVTYANFFGEYFAEPIGAVGDSVCASVTITSVGIPNEIQILGMETDDGASGSCYEGRFDIVVPTPGSTPLPIQISEFTGISKTDGNLLNWSILADNWDNVALERSRDGNLFEAMQSFEFATNSVDKFNFFDENAFETSYYRLKISSDFDEITYSNIIVLEQLKPEPFHVFPNPFLHELKLTTAELRQKEVTAIRVYSSIGNEIFSLNNPLLVSEGIIIQTSDWPQGTYWLSVLTASGDLQNQKIVKISSP